MKHILTVSLTIPLLLNACGAGKGIEVHEVWMRPAAQGENGAVYFVIHNHSAEEEQFVGASTERAEAVEIHETTRDGDVMGMNRVESVRLGASAEVTFAPGELHLMLVNLKGDLTSGSEIELSLHFKNSPDIIVKVPVKDTPAPEDDHSSTNH